MKLDIACGENKKDGFIGLDIKKNCNADIVANALFIPIKDEQIHEVICYHFIEHLYPEETQEFFNEIFRILKNGGKGKIKIDRDWSKSRLFNKDSTHKYRYSSREIRGFLDNFSIKKVENKIYRFKKNFRNKIFVEVVK